MNSRLVDPVKASGLSELRLRVVTFAHVWFGPSVGRLMHWLLKANPRIERLDGREGSQ